MGLVFYSQEDSLCDEKHFIDYYQIEPQSAQFLDSFEMGEFDKLEPWIKLCNQQGIKLGYFYDDTFLKNSQLPQILENLRRCYGEIAQGRPFLHQSQAQREPFVRMVKVLEAAIREGRGIIALCD